MNKNVYLNFILTIAVIALIFLGVMLINAVDRARDTNREVLKKIAQLEETIASKPSQTVVLSAKKTESKVIEKFSTIGNRQYFDSEAQPDGRLIQAVSADTGNMNYLINSEATLATFYGLCSSTPATRDLKDPDKFVPLMAESWTISPDKLTYTVTLKKGILWHDFTDPVTGKKWKDVEVTAHDFKFYLDVIRNPDTNCAPLRVYFKDIESMEVLSKYKFKVVWKNRYFRSKTFTLAMNPLPRHLYHAYKGPFDGKRFNDDHKRNRLIIGCGPYKFLRWDKNRQIVFVRNEKYFGKKYGIMPPIKYRVYKTIKHPNTRFQAILADRLDMLELTPEQWIKRTDVKQFKKKGKLRKLKFLGRAYSYIGYNQSNDLFKDRRVRIALTHLVNREKILRDIYHNLAVITTGPMFINSPGYDKSIKPYKYDVAKAKKLLAEAGWKDTDEDGILDKDGKKFSFTFMQIASSTAMQKILPLIKESFAQAGIEMKIQAFEWTVYIQKLEEKKYDVCMLRWVGAYEFDPYQIWHSSEADKMKTSNHIRFKNKEADRLIEAIRRTFDDKKRNALCREFHRLMHKEQPYTFMFINYELLALNKRYKNVNVFPLGLDTELMWTPSKLQKKVSGL